MCFHFFLVIDLVSYYYGQRKCLICSIFLNLLRFGLCPNMWSIQENVPCAFENNVYFAALGWNALNTSIKSIWSSVSWKLFLDSLEAWEPIYAELVYHSTDNEQSLWNSHPHQRIEIPVFPQCPLDRFYPFSIYAWCLSAFQFSALWQQLWGQKVQ